MGPAAMLGQDLADVAGPVGEGTVADLAAGDRQVGDGHWEQRGFEFAGEAADAARSRFRALMAKRAVQRSARLRPVEAGLEEPEVARLICHDEPFR